MKASASNVHRRDPAYGPAKAIDGNDETRWATDSGTKQAWLEVDLGQPVTFDSVEIDEVYDRVRSFELQYQDAEQWKTFHQGTTLGEQFSAKFEPVTAQRVRLNILDATDGPTITEFRLLRRPK
jgi:alpha-L-fucosidase